MSLSINDLVRELPFITYVTQNIPKDRFACPHHATFGTPWKRPGKPWSTHG